MKIEKLEEYKAYRVGNIVRSEDAVREEITEKINEIIEYINSKDDQLL